MDKLDKFSQRFLVPPEHEFFSPGRVNLIGEHIDYCGGLVMPMAISRGTFALASRSQEARLKVYSERYSEMVEVSFDHIKPKGHWSDFAIGVIAKLKQSHQLRGLNLYVTDDIQAGGLSSSASFSLLLAHSLLWAAGVNISSDDDRLTIARLCQQVEHDYIGVNCGIMDQASIALGGVISLNCDSLDFTRLPTIPTQYEIVVMDTAHPRSLAGSKYNERVAEVAAITQSLAAIHEIENLCQFESTELPALLNLLEAPVLKRRLTHIVTENERVRFAEEALKHSEMKTLGALMDQSHESLRNDYEVTGAALDLIVELSRSQSGCIGARMTGAGFGGCALALVERDLVPQHNERVSSEFQAKTGATPNLFSVTAARATSRVIS